MKNDPEHERQRLAGHYAAMTEGELLNIAQDLDGLTDVAREILLAELGKRQLSLADHTVGNESHQSSQSPDAGQTGPRNDRPGHSALRAQGKVSEDAVLVTVAEFRDVPAALIAKGSLESAGIVCCMLDDNIVRMNWLWSNLVGGVRLQVQPQDIEEALSILGDPIPEKFEVEGEGEYLQPACPQCGSLDVNLHESSPAAYGTMFVSVPLPFVRKGWHCLECGFQWNEQDGSGPTAAGK